MDNCTYHKIEFYLYNYKEIDNIISEIKEDMMSAINVSANAWRKGITSDNNTVENQVIKIIEDKRILELKRWQVLIKKVLAFLLQKYPKYYQFIKLKYENKKVRDEIMETLKIDSNEYEIMKDKLIAFVFKNAKKRNLI